MNEEETENENEEEMVDELEMAYQYGQQLLKNLYSSFDVRRWLSFNHLMNHYTHSINQSINQSFNQSICNG